MIKMMLLLTRKQGLSFDQFRDYYENHHVPLACSFPTPLVHYRRNYITGLTLGPCAYDCITEVWYDLDGNWSDHRDRVVSADMAKIIATDEANFLDRAATRIVIVDATECPPDQLPSRS